MRTSIVTKFGKSWETSGPGCSEDRSSPRRNCPFACRHRAMPQLCGCRWRVKEATGFPRCSNLPTFCEKTQLEVPQGKRGPRHTGWEMAKDGSGWWKGKPTLSLSGHRLRCSSESWITLPDTDDSCLVLAFFVYFEFCDCYCKTFKVLEHDSFCS